jgi:hypothetical protein
LLILFTNDFFLMPPFVFFLNTNSSLLAAH